MSTRRNHSGTAPIDRPLRIGGLLVVLASIAVSVASYGMLADSMRIHWQFGYGPYYGPEFAPTGPLLALFPVLVTVLLAGAGLLERALADEPAFENVRSVFEWTILGGVGCVLAVQLMLVGLNLW